MKPIYPSLIAADLLHLGKVIEEFNPICDGFHIDIMDNHFVPNLTFGAAFANAIAKASHKPTWVHLMVEKPHEWIHLLELMPGSILSFHFENTTEKVQLIRRIREKNYKPSIAISPKTPIEEVLPLCNLVDQILIMSVEPGFYGQIFTESVIQKIEPLRLTREKQNLNFTIGMDGGINAKNIALLSEKGVDEFAAASAIFKSDDPVKAYEALKKLT